LSEFVSKIGILIKILAGSSLIFGTNLEIF